MAADLTAANGLEPGRAVARTRLLLGDTAMDRLGNALVMAVGIGGVGSWAVEMLARSGVRRFVLVDFDSVALTDFNRQVQATTESLGQTKVDALARRIRTIVPEAEVQSVVQRFEANTADALLDMAPDVVLDAIDLLTDKAALIDACLRRGIAVVTSTGAAAKLDPTSIEVVDLASTRIDPMARALRRILKQRYGRSMSSPIGVPAIMTTEPRRCQPTAPRFDEAGPTGECPRKKPVEGSVGWVTAAFGMAACASIIGLLTRTDEPPTP